MLFRSPVVDLSCLLLLLQLSLLLLSPLSSSNLSTRRSTSFPNNLQLIASSSRKRRVDRLFSSHQNDRLSKDNNDIDSTPSKRVCLAAHFYSAETPEAKLFRGLIAVRLHNIPGSLPLAHKVLASIVASLVLCYLFRSVVASSVND